MKIPSMLAWAFGSLLIVVIVGGTGRFWVM